MLRRSIDQALEQASVRSPLQKITVSTLLPIYIRIAGFESLCPDAILAFERAMDKAKLEMEMESIVTKLRDEYWLSKLGGCKGKEKVCQCSGCGGMRLKKEEKYVVMKEKDLVKLPPESAGPAIAPATAAKKTKKTKNAKRQRAGSSQMI
ncbi:hypothetical protein AAF712_011686 [Marasmius tenuissimus]|uniref:Uncharacterized protein n=1 Tax=Marasmius tenuissimus TaxID=585030 RepID=A0ABR2ZJA4_9AGAR